MSRFGVDLLEKVNRICTESFASLEQLLAFYRRELPGRIGCYHQDEVGPVMHHERPGEAEKFVRGVFCLGEATLDLSSQIAQRRARGVRPFIDWFSTPNGDLEWNGGLVRHGYFMLLAKEYRNTREERFARTVIEHMLDYIEGVPPFDPEGKNYLEYKRSTWRPFEVAGRVAEIWPEALAAVIASPAMTPEAWAVIILSIHEQAQFLRKYHWQTGNHAALEVAALGIIGVFYRELGEAAAWREYAVVFLDRMWPRLFYDDGYSREMSGGYHWVAMRSFFSFYEVAARNSFVHLFPARYRQRLLQSSMAELYQDKPDYSTPVTNDSNSLINRKAQLERIHDRFALPEIAFRLSAGKEGKKAEPASHFFPEARIGIMRSDWSAQALYLFFDMGHWGDNHMNEDQLHVEVSAFGRNFLAGCGRWRYTTSDPSAPWMPWARYFKTTSAYNSVIVDGYNQMPGDADGEMVIEERFNYAQGSFSAGYGEETTDCNELLLKERGLTTTKHLRLGGIVHTRKVFFLKPHLWLLRDEIDLGKVKESIETEAEGRFASRTTESARRVESKKIATHTATQIWHFLEGELVQINDNCFTTRFPKANLLIMSLGTDKVVPSMFKGQNQPIAGWHCPYYDSKYPAPELHFDQRGTSAILFYTLLVPYRGSRLPDVPELEAVEEGYRIRHWEGIFTVRAPSRGTWSLLRSKGR